MDWDHANAERNTVVVLPCVHAAVYDHGFAFFRQEARDDALDAEWAWLNVSQSHGRGGILVYFLTRATMTGMAYLDKIFLV